MEGSRRDLRHCFKPACRNRQKPRKISFTTVGVRAKVGKGKRPECSQKQYRFSQHTQKISGLFFEREPRN